MVKYLTALTLGLTCALLTLLCLRVPPVLRALEYDALSRAGAEQALALTARAAEAEVHGIREAVLALVANAVERSDRRLGEALARSDKRLGETIAEVRAARVAAQDRADVALWALAVAGDHAVAAVDGVQPVLRASAGLAGQAEKSLEIMTPFATGLLAAAKVTAGETAQAAKRIDGEMPRLLINLDKLTDHAAGITADAHVLTSRFVAPRTPAQKLWEGIKLISLTAGRVF